MANELEVTGNLFAEIERHIHSIAETSIAFDKGQATRRQLRVNHYLSDDS